MNCTVLPFLLKRPATLLLCILPGLWLCGPSRALADSQPPIMVSVESVGQPTDQVIVTYSVPMTEARVRQDVGLISSATGWAVRNLQVVAGPVQSNPGAGSLYSAQFITPAAINRASSQLPVEPLAMALRDYRQMLIVFDIAGPFTYAGNRSYSSGSMDISMMPRGAGSCTYAFHAIVKQASLSPASGDASHIRGFSGASKTLARLFLALVLASLVGWGAYLLILRLMLQVEGTSSR